MTLRPENLVGEPLALDPVASVAFVVRRGDALHAVVVAKVTFSMAEDDERMVLVEPDAVVRRDLHHGASPRRSLRVASDWVPYLPAADVVLTGHAQPLAGETLPELRVALRLRDGDGGKLLDKELLVRGEASPDGAVVVRRAPLTYERASRHPDNPYGTTGAPAIVDPLAPERPAGFAPWPAAAQSRQRLLDPATRTGLREEPPRLPEPIDWRYFQAAPPDQRVAFLTGDEVVIVEGMHPVMARIERRLPGLRAVARVGGAGGPRALPLVADGLRVDADALRCTLVFRGNFALEDEALPPLAVALAGPGHPPRWPRWPSSEPGETTSLLTSTLCLPASEPAPRAVPEPTGASELRAAGEPTAAREPTAPLSRSPSGPRLDVTIALSEEELGEVSLDGTAVISAAELAPGSAPAAVPFRTPAVASAPPSARAEEADAWGTGTVVASPAELFRAGTQAATPFGPDAERASEAAPSSGSRDTALETTAPRPSQRRSEVPAARFFHVLERVGSTAPVVAAVGPRGGDRAPAFSDDPIALAALPWQLEPPNDVLVVVAKATFELRPDAPAALCAAPEPLNGDVGVSDEPHATLAYASDFAWTKPRAEVFVTGHAYATTPDTTAMLVRFRFGDPAKGGIERRIAVVGDRRWEGRVAPTPSAPAPFERVPLTYERAFGGSGYDDNPVGRGLQRAPDALLPNLEDPEHPLTSPDDRPTPVGLAGRPPTWSVRRGKLGTYDASWLATRWPYYPKDFDPRHFLAAPPAQQLTAIVGDERFELSGMHPEHPKLAGCLPGLRLRAFVQRATAALGQLEPLALTLDTATFDVDRLRLHLVWRGRLPVSASNAPEVVALFACLEPLGAEPLADEVVRARFLGVLPARLAGAPPAARAPTVVPAPLAHGPSADDARRAAVLASVARGESLDGADLREVDLREADLGGARLSRADLRGARLEGALLGGADLSEARLCRAQLVGAVLTEALLRDAELVNANLEGVTAARASLDHADLSGALLTEADFRGARGERVVLAHARCRGTRFEGCVLPDVDFTDALLEAAQFDGAELSRARLMGASGAGVSFNDASLGGARARGAHLPGASCRGVKAPRSVWKEATLDGASFERADLGHANLKGASCQKGCFAGATLTEAILRGAKLGGADFHGANLMQAVLEAADLEKADLRGANLYEAETYKAKLAGAKLERAITTRTKLGLPLGRQP